MNGWMFTFLSAVHNVIKRALSYRFSEACLSYQVSNNTRGMGRGEPVCLSNLLFHLVYSRRVQVSRDQVTPQCSARRTQNAGQGSRDALHGSKYIGAALKAAQCRLTPLPPRAPDQCRQPDDGPKLATAACGRPMAVGVRRSRQDMRRSIRHPDIMASSLLCEFKHCDQPNGLAASGACSPKPTHCTDYNLCMHAS